MSQSEPRPAFYSPLRYPGGKGKIAPYVKSILTLNHLEDCHYVEPYAGGAAVALELLFHEYAKSIHINDLDPGVAAFWRCVLHRTDELCRMVRDAEMTIEEWRIQRKLALSNTEMDDLELGFATFYMNRTNRSGILRAGVIGGLEQAGEWKLDARFNAPDLIKRIEAIARLADRISFTQLDAATLLERMSALPNTFVYLDPPYFGKGKDLYTHFYCDDDHAMISRLVAKLGSTKWIVSYDDADRISELYGRFRSIRYTLSYSAQTRYRGGEIMFFSPKLKMPSFIGSMREIDQVQAA